MSWPAQFRKITEESARWGTVAIMAMVQSADSKEREMVCMPLRKLTGWLMTLQPSRMDPTVAEKVLVYQNECDDVLWDYWTKGSAVNPRMPKITGKGLAYFYRIFFEAAKAAGRNPLPEPPIKG